MGTLRDEVYENLDYLSQLTEIVIGPQNEVLGRAPDRVELTYEQITKCQSRNWGGPGYTMNVHTVLSRLLSYNDQAYASEISQYFKFEVTDDFELDMANQKMTGSITLVKMVQQIDDKEILRSAIDKSCRQLAHYDWPTKRLRDKIATVLNTFEQGRGTEWAKKLDGKVQYQGVNEIKKTMEEMILENKWRIRDTKIIVKLGEWINGYLGDDTDQDMGLVNLMKLKIMLDKDVPVYSLDEVKNADPK